MIKLIREGTYTLIETKKQIKILTLDDMYTFGWIHAGAIGEILVFSHNPHKIDHILAKGKYRLYEVKKEEYFTDLLHLELFVGNKSWQGYLLPNGLPTVDAKRHRIIPTEETITKVFA